jgi:hypothetical protein
MEGRNTGVMHKIDLTTKSRNQENTKRQKKKAIDI